MTTYDPVLALWRRRRERDVMISETTIHSSDAKELAEALRAVADLASELAERNVNLDERIARLEGVFETIGKLKAG